MDEEEFVPKGEPFNLSEIHNEFLAPLVKMMTDHPEIHIPLVAKAVLLNAFRGRNKVFEFTFLVELPNGDIHFEWSIASNHPSVVSISTYRGKSERLVDRLMDSCLDAILNLPPESQVRFRIRSL